MQYMVESKEFSPLKSSNSSKSCRNQFDREIKTSIMYKDRERKYFFYLKYLGFEWHLIRCPIIGLYNQIMIDWRIKNPQTNFLQSPMTFYHTYFVLIFCKQASYFIASTIFASGLVFDFKSLCVKFNDEVSRTNNVRSH